VGQASERADSESTNSGYHDCRQRPRSPVPAP